MDRRLVTPSPFHRMPNTENELKENQCPLKHPCCSSPCVHVFLAVPSEFKTNNISGSPDLCSKQTDEASLEMDGGCTMITANQIDLDTNEYANTQTLPPSCSSSLNEFTTESLRTSDTPYVQLKQYTSLPRSLPDEMPHNKQLKPAIMNTDICDALPLGAQNEKNLMDEKRTDAASQSMNNQNLAYKMPKSRSSSLYYQDHTGTDIYGNPEFGELGSESKFIQRPAFDVYAVEKSIALAENQLLYDKEVSHHQRAMHRCPGFKTQIRNVESNVSGAESEKKLMDTYTSTVEPTEASSSKKSVQWEVQTDMSCQKGGASHVAVLRTSDTVGNLEQATRTPIPMIERNICQGDTPFSGSKYHVVQTSKDQLPSTTCLATHDSISLTVSMDKVFPTRAVNNNDVVSGGQSLNQELPMFSDSYQALLNARNFKNCLLPDLADHRYLPPCNMTWLPAESTRKKRKKRTMNEGKKYCCCKRSECLKLYCDCFAAGTVCTESCGCRECSNRPEYEEIIHKTRKKIESRNPLAFAPRIVLGASNRENNNEESINNTPLARHKKGCSCRKSFCLKKYCECFQAGVRCSLDCRCGGCKNRKDVVGSDEGIEIEHQKPNEEKGSSVNRIDEVEKMEVVKSEPRLSPSTPSIQCSNGTGADIPKPSLNMSCQTSQEFSAPLLLCHGETSSSPIRSTGDQEWDYEAAEDAGGPLSPRWDDLADLCDLSRLWSPSPSTRGTCIVPQINYSPVIPVPPLCESKILAEEDMNRGVDEDTGTGTPHLLKQAPEMKSTFPPDLRNTVEVIPKSVPPFTPYP